MWLDRVKKVYKDDLQITWKNFSLEQVNSKNGPEWKAWEQPDITERRALLAAVAGEAARRQGPELYEKFHLALLKARHGGGGSVENRIALNEEEPLIKLAEEVGLDVARFREDLRDPELRQIVGRDHEGAVEGYGIFGTPTFLFENGTTAYVKSFIPPDEDAVAEFEHFMALMGHRSYIGEIKRPQPPWPKGVIS
ncbi:MAG: DsbA family protein [Chloroflexi bacterium]|nr:DsbA family protein [Chloroflexota bacterium]